MKTSQNEPKMKGTAYRSVHLSMDLGEAVALDQCLGDFMVDGATNAERSILADIRLRLKEAMQPVR